MNKYLIAICVFYLSISHTFSQQSKNESLQLILGIADFTARTEQQAKFTDVLKERVTDALNQTGRFHLVDIDGTARNESIKKAQSNYKSENWIDDKKSISAEYTLTAYIGDLKFIKINGGAGYKATITYTIKIMNTEKGSIITNGTSTFQSTESKIMLSPENALQDAINTTQDLLIEYVKSSFPIKVRIAKIQEIKKEKACVLIVKGGKKNGIQEGQGFVVKLNDYSMGEAFSTEIGKIKITKVVNENFSEAKVISGGETILKHFYANDEIINELIKN